MYSSFILALQLKARRSQGEDTRSTTPLTPSDIRDAFRLLREQTGEGAVYAASIHQTLGGGGGMARGKKGRKIGIG